MEELLQKDTLIDQQAVLNKNLQKRIDSTTDQTSTLNQQYMDAMAKLSSVEQDKVAMKHQIAQKDT